jgi:hypothetical protein
MFDLNKHSIGKCQSNNLFLTIRLFYFLTDLIYYVPNGEWELLATPVNKVLIPYGTENDSYVEMHFVSQNGTQHFRKIPPYLVYPHSAQNNLLWDELDCAKCAVPAQQCARLHNARRMWGENHTAFVSFIHPPSIYTFCPPIQKPLICCP